MEWIDYVIEERRISMSALCLSQHMTLVGVPSLNLTGHSVEQLLYLCIVMEQLIDLSSLYHYEHQSFIDEWCRKSANITFQKKRPHTTWHTQHSLSQCVKNSRIVNCNFFYLTVIFFYYHIDNDSPFNSCCTNVYNQLIS